MTLRIAPPLLAATARAMSWPPIAAAAALGWLLVGLVGRGGSLSLDELLAATRIAAIALGVATAFALDDAAAAVTAAVPVGPRTRAAARLLVAFAAAGAAWAGVLVLASGKTVAGGERFPALALTLEAVTTWSAGVLAAAVVRAVSRADEPGYAAASSLLALAAATLVLPGRLRPWASPGTSAAEREHWLAVHRGWAIALALSLVALFALLDRRPPVAAARGGPRSLRTPNVRRSRC